MQGVFLNLVKEKKERRARVPPHFARGALLEVAAELFCRYGLNVVTIEHLAQASRLNKMSVYRLFGSREAFVRGGCEQGRSSNGLMHPSRWMTTPLRTFANCSAISRAACFAPVTRDAH